MKKIYFAGSITGGRDKQEEYLDLIEYLTEFGQVMTKDVWNENFENQKNIEESIYKRHVEWIDSSDIIIAEISVPSMGVGYELGYSESKNKKIICLYDENSEKEPSMMISGNIKNNIIRYKNLQEVKKILKEMLQ